MNAKSSEQACLAAFGLSSEIATAVGPDMCFEGTLTIKMGRPVLISGLFTGEINSDGAVIVAEDGVVRGGIKARQIAINGTVDATEAGHQVVAEECLILASSAKVTAPKVIYGDLQIERGARVFGAMEFNGRADSVQRSAPRATEAPVGAPVQAVRAASVSTATHVAAEAGLEASARLHGAVGGQVVRLPGQVGQQGPEGLPPLPTLAVATLTDEVPGDHGRSLRTDVERVGLGA